MLGMMARNWWMIVLRGVFAIAFGVLAWTWPGITLGVLVLMWGAYAFADGVLALIAAVSGASGKPWWMLTLEGLVGIGAAAVAFFYPGITTLVLLYMIAAWAIVTGIFEIVAAIQLRKEIEGEFWLALAGVASLVFGAILIARPAVGALAVTWMIGLYSVAFGALLIAVGFRVRSLKPLVPA